MLTRFTTLLFSALAALALSLAPLATSVRAQDEGSEGPPSGGAVDLPADAAAQAPAPEASTPPMEPATPAMPAEQPAAAPPAHKHHKKAAKKHKKTAKKTAKKGKSAKKTKGKKKKHHDPGY